MEFLKTYEVNGVQIVFFGTEGLLVFMVIVILAVLVSFALSFWGTREKEKGGKKWVN